MTKLKFGGPTVRLPEFKSRDQRTAADHALLELVDALRLSALDGGVRLPPLGEIATAVHVSPSNVRAALKVLEQAGVVEISPGRGGGVFIQSLGNIPRALDRLYPAVPIEEVDMLFEAVFMTERTIARLAAIRATEQDIEQIRERLVDIELGTADAVMDYLERTIRFQISMATVARNAFLRGQFTELMNRLSFTVSLGVDPDRIPKHRIEESKKHYAQLFTAFAERDLARIEFIVDTRHTFQRDLFADVQ